MNEPTNAPSEKPTSTPSLPDSGGSLPLSQAIRQAFDVLDEVVGEITALPAYGVPVAEVQRQLTSIQGYHRQKLIQTFRSALGVSIELFLLEPQVNQFMVQKIAENVDLIKTIPERMHAGLKLRMEEALGTAPFDQQQLTGVLRDEYKSSGYNLRRITRDQTSKTVGNLTQIRQQQLGVEQYEWVTSQDERVRPSHSANSGLLFDWHNPPGATGHPGEDIMCRCVAIAVLTPATRDRLTGQGPSSIISLDAA